MIEHKTVIDRGEYDSDYFDNKVAILLNDGWTKDGQGVYMVGDEVVKWAMLQRGELDK